MKECTTCKVILTNENTYKKGTRSTAKCKPCFNKYCSARWIKRKLDAIQLKGDKCFDCNTSYPYQVYDFHHLDASQKDMDWTKLRMFNLKRIHEELSKCVLLCANCHRIRHIY